MTTRQIPERWGLCFAGNEQAFCDALIFAAFCTQGRPFYYYEIGIGAGDCLAAVNEYLIARDIGHRIVGVDLPGAVSAYTPETVDTVPLDRIGHVFTGSSEFFARCKRPADFIFIDACHGYNCATADFLGAERLIKPGGVVCFHDTDPQCQGWHHQPHCETGIDVRLAVKDLGLLDGIRPGWKCIAETTGDKSRGGHGCLFVQKVG